MASAAKKSVGAVVAALLLGGVAISLLQPKTPRFADPNADQAAGPRNLAELGKQKNKKEQGQLMQHLLEHDTVHNNFDGTLELTDVGLSISGVPIAFSSTRDATKIPWKEAGVDYVCESTGAKKVNAPGCKKHIEGGAEKVIISAPAKDDETPTIVVGVNVDDHQTSMKVVSCDSCTTNGLALLAKVISEKFRIRKGFMTTVHASTNSQLTADGTVKGDWRGGLAAFQNIVPSSTGAAKTVAKAYPVMAGKFTGMAFPIPPADVSVVDLTCKLETTYDEIKVEVKRASEDTYKDIVGYTEDLVVSSDLIGETFSTVSDTEASIMLTPTFVKFVSWYDNEWGYCIRLVDLVGTMTVKDGIEGKEEGTVYFTARKEKHAE